MPTVPHYADEVVLQSSSQIIPLLQFEQEQVITDFGPLDQLPPFFCENAHWRDSVTQIVMEEYIATLHNIIN
jgi:hypothetical protein